MSAQGDLGVEVVREVVEHREFRNDGIRGRDRGFVCGPLGVTQELWSDGSVDEWGGPVWRVHVRTGVLKNFEGTPVQVRALSDEMSKSALSALVRDVNDQTRLQLASSFHVNATNREWAPHLLRLILRQQLVEAKYLGFAPALLEAGILADMSAGNAAGPCSQTKPDPFKPETLRDADPEDVLDMAEMLATLQKVWDLYAVRTPRGITATVPCPDRSWGDMCTLVEIEAKSDSRLGLGLSVSLSLPGWADVPDALVFAEAELKAGSRTDLLGSWFVTGNVLMYRSFFPVFVATKAMALQLATSAARRALWLSLGRGVPRRDGLEMDRPPVWRLLNDPSTSKTTTHGGQS